ncbi:putative coiled-coil domain-containing protein 196 [Ornithorhynchus anatinus]|uniref:Coiled-coil domain containing 196 n=1 Tax=Ornithorhynchus anatinus TaxID=9258 RepID=A0A6I8NG73_ORNAN|nr:putative coiled-coil domain-containing protein 196 [Ornithorhynchus anatinus]
MSNPRSPGELYDVLSSSETNRAILHLKELNDDLKKKKQELKEMLSPLEAEKDILFQQLMINLEEKQRSLQIMARIMAGKGDDSEDSLIHSLENIKEAELLKQSLEKRNEMLWKEMETLWSKDYQQDEFSDLLKQLLHKNKEEMQVLRELAQRKFQREEQ